jgi:hypothetical protein
MARLSRHTIRSLNSAGKSIAKVGDKSAVGLFRFATADHTGITKHLINMPKMGFLDSLQYMFMQLLLSLLASIFAGVLMFLLIAYGIPFLLHVLFFT